MSTRDADDGSIRRNVPALDGVRAVAIGGVFGLHLIRSRFPGGAFGVDVFFVLSAYLITSILLAELRSTGAIRYGAFYWRRVCRLGPALVLWLALAGFTAALAHQGGTVPLDTGGALFYFNDFLQAGVGHVSAPYDQSWSLAVEEQFYLLWPVALAFVALHLSARSQRWALRLLVVGAAAIWWRTDAYFLPTGHLLPLALGCWAAFYLARGAAHRSRPGGLRRIAASPLVAALSLLVLLASFESTPLGTKGRVAALLVYVAATVLVIHCATVPASAPSKLLAARPVKWIGERSYGIYLYGLTLAQLIPLLTHAPLHVAAPIDLAATGVVVAASYRFVEAPLRAAGRRWLATRGAPAAPSLAPEGRPS